MNCALHCRYYTEKVLAWCFTNKMIVFLGLLSFCLFVSTLALAGQKNRLISQVEELQQEIDKQTTATTDPTAESEATTQPADTEQTTQPEVNEQTTQPAVNEQTTQPAVPEETTITEPSDQTSAPEANEQTTTEAPPAPVTGESGNEIEESNDQNIDTPKSLSSSAINKNVEMSPKANDTLRRSHMRLCHTMRRCHTSRLSPSV